MEFADQLLAEVVQSIVVVGGGAGTIRPLISMKPMSPLAEICATLKLLQTQRRHCIRLQSKCDRATEALIARTLGYHAGLEQKERKKLFSEAARLRRLVESGDAHPVGDIHQYAGVAALSPLIAVSAQARAGFDAYRDQTEKQMRKLARKLPVWPWVESVKGFGDLGLAIVVAEAGDLSNYCKMPGKRGEGPQKLWKRLGLAVIGDVRQGGLGRTASADEWIVHGYNRVRRSEMWVIADSMFKKQWAGERDGYPAHPTGPYGLHYAHKKSEYLAREWTPGHANNAARRYMTKALIRDLWIAWRNFAVEFDLSEHIHRI